MPISIGRIGIWTGVLDAHPASVTIDAAKRIEQLGYETLWIPETVGRDPFVLAGLLLAGTSELRLATGIANIYARDAMTMSAVQQSLVEAYPDRFLLGLGVSHHHLVERVRHHAYDKPLSYMRQYLDDMDAALYLAVRPTTPTPRVLAALGPKMLRTAAERADGAHPYFTTPEHTRSARSILGPEPLLAPEQMVVLETDPSVARSVARAAMVMYLRAPNYQNNLLRLGFERDDFADPANPSDRLVDAIVAWGDSEQIAARVQEHLDAGADHVCVQVLRADTAVPLAEWAALAPVLLG